MRVFLVLLLAALVVPPAAAHDENLIYRLRIDAVGPAAGPIGFQLHDDHKLLGIGVGGCSLGTVGALRIVTPTQGTLEVTFSGTACTSEATGLSGDASRLAAGQYVGGYALALTGPILIEVYATHV